MADTYCSNCKKYTDVVHDYSAGDSVCTECGLVLEASTIDETAKWRIHANESTNHDPVRVGGPFNPLIGDSLLGRVISNSNGVVTNDFLARGSNRNRGVIEGFKTIDDMCDRLGLVKTIKDRACEMYEKLVKDGKASRRKDKNAILAACLYIACRLEDKPRSVKEICSVANVVSFGGAMQYVTKQVKVEKDLTVRAGDFVGRFCSNLGVTKESVVFRAAREAVENCGEFDIRRSPVSIAATVVYIVTQLSDQKKSLEDVLRETGVTEGTIKNSYKDIYPHLVKIIPSWFAQEEDFKNLKC